MTSTSTLGLILNLWVSMHKPGFCTNLPRRRIWQFAICIPAYLVFLAFFIEAYSLGSTPVPQEQALNSAIPTTFYCIIIENGIVNNSPRGVFRILVSVYIYSAIILGITLFIEAYILYSLLKQKFILQETAPYLKDVFLRVFIFSLYRTVSLIMLAFIIHDPSSLLVTGLLNPTSVYEGYAELVQAAAPLVAFLILATRSDVCLAWGLRRRRTTLDAIRDAADTQRPLKSSSDNNSPEYSKRNDSPLGDTDLEKQSLQPANINKDLPPAPLPRTF